MDWLPTLLAAAGTEPDAAYPSDGDDLLPVLLGTRAPYARTLYWRYKAHAQRAVRDGDWKYLKINENEFLFNVVDDVRERANLRDRYPEVFRRLRQQWEAWNNQQLPITEAADHSLVYQGPVAEDSTTWVRGRLDAATQEFRTAGLPVPQIFEFPHYAGSAVDYQTVAERFGVRWERALYAGGLLQGGTVDYGRLLGQLYPYVVRDVYGTVFTKWLNMTAPQAQALLPLDVGPANLYWTSANFNLDLFEP